VAHDIAKKQPAAAAKAILRLIFNFMSDLLFVRFPTQPVMTFKTRVCPNIQPPVDPKVSLLLMTSRNAPE
jgi:hypothetical protein